MKQIPAALALKLLFEHNFLDSRSGQAGTGLLFRFTDERVVFRNAQTFDGVFRIDLDAQRSGNIYSVFGKGRYRNLLYIILEADFSCGRNGGIVQPIRKIALRMKQLHTVVIHHDESYKVYLARVANLPLERFRIGQLRDRPECHDGNGLFAALRDKLGADLDLFHAKVLHLFSG